MRAKKSKKEAKTKDKTPEKAEPLQPERSGTVNEEADNERPDFGGLPDRSLKKNLGGCG